MTHPDPVDTLQGPMQGVLEDDVRIFRGIPYARPPVGELRFKPPQPARPWQGVLAADTFAASCVQPRHTSTFVWRREDFEVSEDCLYLNIWAPENAHELPVMVWFHGGAHTSGQGHARIFDGTALAQRGVVLVTLNYRLGPFGFLAHPWLADESDHNSAGNYGLLDKIAALNWVRDNIAQVGGDPANVTVFGQSAGSQSVCSLMASPLSEGLFHKAIGQSAACVGPAPAQDANGFARGGTLVEALKVQNLDALRSQEADAILQAAQTTGWADRSRITVDGWVLPEAQVNIYRRGEQHNIPLLLGSLANEGIELIPRNDALTRKQLDAYLDATFGQQGPALLALYADALEQSPGHAQHAIVTDLFMTFGMRRWAEYQAATGADTYLYFMDHTPPAFHLYMPEQPELKLPGGPRSAGAYHSGDLAYVFDTMSVVGVDWQESDRQLADLMATYWTNFARTGNPNGDNLPTWLPFNAEDATTLRLNTEAQTEKGIRRDALDLMAEALPR